MPLHVIQFPNRAEYGRAVTALGEVPRTRVGLPEFKMVVEDDHIKALNQAGVPYTDLTKDPRREPPTPVQP
ncbi:MAG TPA: hypothetical protein VEL76_25090 [Gemmataceae bacterium]|nr:hypothetical protein [Gemmataceae bacterium]